MIERKQFLRAALELEALFAAHKENSPVYESVPFDLRAIAQESGVTTWSPDEKSDLNTFCIRYLINLQKHDSDVHNTLFNYKHASEPAYTGLTKRLVGWGAFGLGAGTLAESWLGGVIGVVGAAVHEGARYNNLRALRRNIAEMPLQRALNTLDDGLRCKKFLLAETYSAERPAMRLERTTAVAVPS